MPAHAVVLFDGVCNLCNASVQFIIDRDPDGYFQFSQLQSPYAQQALSGQGITVNTAMPDSIVLIQDGHVFQRSTAALRIAKRLRGPVKLLWVGLLTPRPIRDAVYRWIAGNRYRWFGRSESCRVPTPALRRRFLE